jgi:hypothetical protein
LSSDKKNFAALDDLERELGLSIDDPNSAINATWTSVDPRSSDSSKKGPKRVGCIPQSWIFGLFSGSLPPDQAGQLLDWAILENERFAGTCISVSWCNALTFCRRGLHDCRTVGDLF